MTHRAAARPIGREDLLAHLLRRRLAGPDVPTPRQKNLRSYRLLGQGDPEALMGLDPERRWGAAAVLELMAERCGVHPDPATARALTGSTRSARWRPWTAGRAAAPHRRPPRQRPGWRTGHPPSWRASRGASGGRSPRRGAPFSLPPGARACASHAYR